MATFLSVFRFYVLLGATLPTAVAAIGADPVEIPGPVRADLIRVVDGDTILVSAMPWPQQSIEVYVRLRGIDAPEKKGKCADGRRAGLLAQQALSEMLDGQSHVQLMQVAGDKYFGRVIADVRLEDGRNPAQELLSGGFVVAYDGGRKTRACPISQSPW